MRNKHAALFIDAENLFYLQRGLGWAIDYGRLLRFFEQHYSIYNSFFYTVLPEEKDQLDEKVRFTDALSFAGYTVRKKKLKLIHAAGKTIRKGNVDIEIVVDMFNTSDLYEVAILFSGDSDFERALELLRSRGKEIIVVSARGYVAKELINTADKYVDLALLRGELEAVPGSDTPHLVTPGLFETGNQEMAPQKIHEQTAASPRPATGTGPAPHPTTGPATRPSSPRKPYRRRIMKPQEKAA